MIRTRFLTFGLLAAASAALVVSPSVAMMTAPSNLAELVKDSSDIVVGTVLKVTEGRQGSLPYVEVEVALAEAIRGTLTETMTFRQLGMGAPGAPVDGRRPLGTIAGFPQYVAGERVMLFLGPASSHGFRAPVGLQQGKFSIRAGGAENGLHNTGLFRDLVTGATALSDSQRSMLATQQGAVNADTFIDFVRQGVQQRWWD